MDPQIMYTIYATEALPFSILYYILFIGAVHVSALYTQAIVV